LVDSNGLESAVQQISFQRTSPGQTRSR